MEPCRADWAHEVRVSPAELRPMLDQLVEAGFLQSRAASHARDHELEWNTTLAGGALTMASFLKPIS
jgi:hypothetical protein